MRPFFFSSTINIYAVWEKNTWSLITNWSVVKDFSGYTGNTSSDPTHTSLYKSGSNIIYGYGGGSQSIHCLPALNISDYSKITITVDSKTDSSQFVFGVTPSGYNIESGRAILSQIITGTGTYSIDISNCNGNYIFAFRCYGASTGSATISAIDFYYK